MKTPRKTRGDSARREQRGASSFSRHRFAALCSRLAGPLTAESVKFFTRLGEKVSGYLRNVFGDRRLRGCAHKLRGFRGLRLFFTSFHGVFTGFSRASGVVFAGCEKTRCFLFFSRRKNLTGTPRLRSEVSDREWKCLGSAGSFALPRKGACARAFPRGQHAEGGLRL